MNRIVYLLSAILISLALVGCAGTVPVKPEQSVIVQNKYIIKLPPADLLTLPKQIERIDPDKVKNQSDAARWIIANEERTRTLEDMIRGIAMFFTVEQAKLNDLEKAGALPLAK
jgi:hypothetical protein